MSLLKEFKLFAMRGNVLDLAVGVVLGAAFGKIVASLVEDVIMPPIGVLLGGIDFGDFFIDLTGRGFATLAQANAAGAATLRYGLFLNTVVNFLVVALAVFLLLKQVNRFVPRKEEPPPARRDCPSCLSSIPVAARRCAFCCVDLEAA